MRFTRRRRTTCLALCSTVAVSLSACGSAATPTGPANAGSTVSTTRAFPSAPSAVTIYYQFRKSIKTSTSVHIKASYTDQGQQVRLDIAGDTDGRTSRAYVSDSHGEFEVLNVDGTTYLKAGAAYWTKNGSAAMAKIAAGRYFKAPVGLIPGIDDLKVRPLMDKLFAEDMSSADKVDTTVGTTDVDGVSAYLLTTSNGQGTKVYVSTDAERRLLRVVTPKKRDGTLNFGEGTLNFSEWDAVAPVSAPHRILQIPGF